jgi:putative transposase
MGLSQRRVCKALGVARSMARYQSRLPERDKELVSQMRELAGKHPRFGYRRVAALLRADGWRVNDKRVRRLWRQEGFKIPRKGRKKRRLGHSGNSCTRRRAASMNEVWSYDFVFDQTADGRTLKILPVVDEFTCECLVMVGRSLPGKVAVTKSCSNEAASPREPSGRRHQPRTGLAAPDRMAAAVVK